MHLHFLALPREIRDQIYSYLLLSQGEVQTEFVGSKIQFHPLKTPATCNGKAIAYLHTFRDPKGYLFSTCAVEQVNRQTRAEFLDFLRIAPIDIAIEVQNFDFTNLIRCIKSLPRSRQEDFLVRGDGTSTSTLKLDLRGPYNHSCRSNLQIWIAIVESWAGFGELATAHGTGFGLPIRRYLGKPELILWLYDSYQAHRKGAGRLELSAMFFTLFHSDGDLVLLRDARAPRNGNRGGSRSWGLVA